MKPEIAMFMKVFGQEVKFARMTPSVLQQLANQLVDLLLEKKSEVQTALGGMLASSVTILVLLPVRICQSFLLFLLVFFFFPSCSSVPPFLLFFITSFFSFHFLVFLFSFSFSFFNYFTLFLVVLADTVFCHLFLPFSSHQDFQEQYYHQPKNYQSLPGHPFPPAGTYPCWPAATPSHCRYCCNPL